jgi:hypothetical protein
VSNGAHGIAVYNSLVRNPTIVKQLDNVGGTERFLLRATDFKHPRRPADILDSKYGKRTQSRWEENTIDAGSSRFRFCGAQIEGGVRKADERTDGV